MMDKTITETFVMSSENTGEEELILPGDQGESDERKWNVEPWGMKENVSMVILKCTAWSEAINHSGTL